MTDKSYRAQSLSAAGWNVKQKPFTICQRLQQLKTKGKGEKELEIDAPHRGCPGCAGDLRNSSVKGDYTHSKTTLLKPQSLFPSESFRSGSNSLSSSWLQHKGGDICLILSRWTLVMVRVLRTGIIQFLTPYTLCVFCERGTLSASLTYISDWLFHRA